MEILMKNPLMLIAIIGFFTLLLFLAFKSSQSPYVPVKALMTDAELNFYRQLMRVIPPGILVFSKVRIADVVDVKQSIKGKGRIKHFNPIAAKHFDFVLVGDQKMNVLCAIELNDSSHERKDRKERDVFVRKVMASAKLPLFEVKASRKYKLDSLKSDIEVLLSKRSPAPTSASSGHDDNATINAKQTDTDDFNHFSNISTANVEEATVHDNVPHVPFEQTVPAPKPQADQDDYVPRPLSSFMDDDERIRADKPIYDDLIELNQRMNANQK